MAEVNHTGAAERIHRNGNWVGKNYSWVCRLKERADMKAGVL